MTNPPQQPPSNQPPPVINIPQMIAQSHWELSNFTAEPIRVQESRIKREESEATHKRWRSTILFVATLIGLGYIFYLCAQILNNPNATADDKKWATAITASIVSGSVGFVTGKAIA